MLVVNELKVDIEYKPVATSREVEIEDKIVTTGAHGNRQIYDNIWHSSWSRRKYITVAKAMEVENGHTVVSTTIEVEAEYLEVWKESKKSGYSYETQR